MTPPPDGYSAPDALFHPGGELATPRGGGASLPRYLVETYSWAYLTPRNVALLDRQPVVWAILWGNDRRLQRAAFAELEPGRKVLLPAHVYGDFPLGLARFLGPQGRLEVIDIAPVQVENCRRKLAGFSQARVRLADAASPGGGPYDAVCCFFLLHELPDDYKRQVVDALLATITPSGKAVFIDYHKPHPAHPLKWPMNMVFDNLEPYAKGLWRNEIADFASSAAMFSWRKQTYFGGLYQKTVACRLPG